LFIGNGLTSQELVVFRAAHVLAFDEPVHWNPPRKGLGTCTALSPNVSEAILSSSGRSHDNAVNVGAWIDSHDVSRQVDVAICLLPALVELLVHGRWHVLPLIRYCDTDHSWRSRFDVQRKRARVDDRLCTGLPEPVESRMDFSWDPGVSWAQADSLAFVFSYMLQQSFHIDEESEQFIMLESLMRLFFMIGEAWRPQVLHHGMHLHSSGTSGPRMYTAVALVQTCVLAGLLRNTGKLKRVIMKALAFALPPRERSMVEQTLSTMQVPDASVVSRFRFVLDVGIMLWHRKHNAELERQCNHGNDRILRYMLSDASPQGLEDWQITESYTISQPLSVARAVDELANLKQQLQSRMDDTDDFDMVGHNKDGSTAEDKLRMTELTELLVRNVQHHVLPPVGLGLRKASLTHKLDSVLHSTWLEVGSRSALDCYNLSVHSFCVDLGVERFIGDAPAVQDTLLQQCVDAPMYEEENGFATPHGS
jgi:hypothetical protein